MAVRSSRYFVGIDLDNAARAACSEVAARIQNTGFPAAFESADKLHLTLAFLGNVPEERAGEPAAALQRAASLLSPFTLTLDCIGAFPHERRPRVVYVGARQQGAAFRNAAGLVRTEYQRLGFSFKDDAIAHVTIARVKGSDDTGPSPAIHVEPRPILVEAFRAPLELRDGA
jgi:2'-5' RNA ligase